MPALTAASPITAIIYNDGRQIDTTMRSISIWLKERNHALAGFVQLNEAKPGRTRCNMILEELASGMRVGISEDRGPEARGCMLNMAELTRASMLATAALERGPDVLVINKFGKTEANGGGFRPLIAEALSRGIAILIAVPEANLPQWQLFSAGLAIDHPIAGIPSDPASALRQLGFTVSDTADDARAQSAATLVG